jgi:hypothetical protein
VFLLLAALVGFSSQAYLPVRAGGNPAINENDPVSWNRFKGLLERKQYGQESMIRRMFKRRGSWVRQLVSDPRFGLWATFGEQYGLPDRAVPAESGGADNRGKSRSNTAPVLPVILILLGIFGAYTAVKRAPPDGVFLVLIFLLCTLGMVVYMNFSDGSYNTAIAPVAEVRNRDYFYTPGFVYFGIMIGLGLAYLLERIAGMSTEARNSPVNAGRYSSREFRQERPARQLPAARLRLQHTKLVRSRRYPFHQRR